MAKFLTRDEEYELIRRAKAGDLAARNTLVERNLGLLYKAAHQVSRRYRLDAEELLGVAAERFIFCIEKFDCSRGYRLSTLALRAMINHVNRIAYEDFGTIRVSGGYCCRAVTNRLTESCMEDVVRARSVKSIHTRLNGKGGDIKTIAETLRFRDDESPNSEYREVPWSVVETAMTSLPERMRKIVQMRIRMTAKQVGEELGVSGERIRQIYESAIAKLRRQVQVLMRKQGV